MDELADGRTPDAAVRDAVERAQGARPGISRGAGARLRLPLPDGPRGRSRHAGAAGSELRAALLIPLSGIALVVIGFGLLVIGLVVAGVA